MALPPEALRAVPISVLASGGLSKAPVVEAILRAGYVNHIVTDVSCARALLA
jgi:DNA-binding transcriptional regulator LsrR (DeoR family)